MKKYCLDREGKKTLLFIATMLRDITGFLIGIFTITAMLGVMSIGIEYKTKIDFILTIVGLTGWVIFIPLVLVGIKRWFVKHLKEC